jgi:hypothetical protein
MATLIPKFKQTGTGAVNRDISLKLAETASVKDFGAVGNGVANDRVAIQNAVTAICGAGKTLLFPAGTYLIDAPITFPNSSFMIQGEGPTLTAIKAFNPAASTDLFDFTGTTGGQKVIKNISFEGPAVSNYGAGAGIKANTNGLYLDNVWFRGILYGLRATGSFINCNMCVAEFCYIATSTTAALDESIWYGWAMYRNEFDFILPGANNTFIVRDTTCIGTKTEVMLVESGMLIDGVVIEDTNPVSGYTPSLVRIYGSNNIVNNVTSTNFGTRGMFFEGAAVTGNKISNVTFSGITNGILFSLASKNNLNNITVSGSTTGYGIYFDTAPTNTIENFMLSGNKYGVRISAANDNCLYNGIISSSVTSDFYSPVANTTNMFISNVNANFSGIASLPYKMSILSNGQKQVSATAAPTTSTWTVGDLCVNSTPAVGQPKGWACTVAGTPGTWVSQGNL